MKTSGIGGQAVIEGIMMRNKDKYSIAVRKPDNEIEVVVKESKLITEKYKWLNYPIIRGIFNFVDSLVTGISTIEYSASFYDDPSEQSKTKIDEVGKHIFKDKLESVLMAFTVILSVIFAVGLFMLLPYFISKLLGKFIVSSTLLNFIEGVIRVVIFILYLMLISLMKDIKRTFMYHGAEHKCINCIENGMPLTPVNVKNSSRYHKRCGTSFLFFVMFVSIIFFIFIRVNNTALQIVIRILLIPVIAGVSYELIRFAGKEDNKFVDILSKPGMWLQSLTTREPDMDMIEVAIKAVEEVFDWRAFLVSYYENSESPEAEIAAKEAEFAISSQLINEKKTSRSIKTEDIEIPEDSHISLAYEASDESESTIHDKVYEEAEQAYAKYAEAKETETEDAETNGQLHFDEEDDDLPEGFDFIEEPDAGHNSDTDAVSGDAATLDTSEEFSKEEVEAAFEFEDDDAVKEDFAEEVPLFKQRNFDK